jgi:hypothetical protein
MQRGSLKRPLMKKEATQKNAKGLIKKTSDEKRGNPETAKGLIKKISEGRRSTCKVQKFPTNTHVYRSQLR